MHFILTAIGVYLLLFAMIAKPNGKTATMLFTIPLALSGLFCLFFSFVLAGWITIG